MYLPRSAVRPTILSFSFAALTRACPNGADVVFWPVYTDYPANEWNTAVKQEYAQQAGKLGCPVLYVNSLCKDKVGDDIARGGAALFVGGTIVQEVPSGEENVLFVEA